MTQIFEKPVADDPIHVFVLGVSRYIHLDDGTDPTNKGQASGLQQLTSAARSASEFAAWAMESLPADRLASVYVNLAPAPGEILHEKVATLNTPTALREPVISDWKKFSKACNENRSATAYVYVAGHGVQIAREGAILLLEDFGNEDEATLWAALDIPKMNRKLRNAESAHLQYWFVDCCRERTAPETYSVASLESAYPGPGDPCAGEADAAPIFFATLPRETAWARTNGVSLFNEGLLKALRRDAATDPDDEGRWRITTSSLAKSVEEHVRAESGDLGQKVHLAGHPAAAADIVFEFTEPPEAQLVVTLNPPAAHGVATADIDKDNVNHVRGAADWPVTRTLPAGIYVISVKAEPHYSNRWKSVRLTPPRKEPEIKLS